ncbi:MAG: Xaa-Pro peptidase family protein [Muribaculaceae bacterium]|nr:Xaa-Pro peptidase family protein [Muribaculaceae bacterium]
MGRNGEHFFSRTSRKEEGRLLLLPEAESCRRLDRVRSAMLSAGIRAGLVSGNASKFYLTGRVFVGWILVTQDSVTYYVRRPVELEGDNVVYVRKPEEIDFGCLADGELGLELDCATYSSIERLSAAAGIKVPGDLSKVLRKARSVKTDMEIEMIERSGKMQEGVYRRIPGLYAAGMSDIEFQIEIEHLSRLSGCLGQFRIAGDSMELFMGNVLAGDNADSPTPYDFAMGGAGVDPSLPVGADGTVIAGGMTVMVDVNGNYTGYMTDMTRVYRVGSIDSLAEKAHRCSMDILRALEKSGVPGAKASEMYEEAESIVKERGLHAYFMGHRQHAGFIGHGVGIEINEAPVIAPRSRDVLEVGNVIAIEPKFVIPGTGAVGVENTYVVTCDGLRCLTNLPEEITELL